MLKKFTLTLTTFIVICGCAYSFVGNRLSSKVKTYSVIIYNKTAKINDSDEANFFDLLKKMIQRAHNKLAYVNQNGDLHFDITIEKLEIYTNAISSIDGEEGSTSQRLTMEIEVTYKNNITGEYLEKKKFSDHEDIDGNIDLDSQMNSYMLKVSEKIIRQVVDETINEW